MSKPCGQCNRHFHDHTEIIEREDVESWRDIPHGCNYLTRFRRLYVAKVEKWHEDHPEGIKRARSGAHIEDEYGDREKYAEMTTPKRHAARPNKNRPTD